MTPSDSSYGGWVLSRLRFAFRGMFWFFAEPTNLWIHLPAAAIVVLVGVWLKIDRVDWCLILFAIALVFVSEALNSALESLADAVHPDQHPLVGRAKDVAAGAVLIACFIAAAIGLIVFLPRFFLLLWPSS